MKKDYFWYNPKLKEKARELRKNSTLSEVLLWNRLKKKQLKGYDFDRQKPIGNYIVDFYCHELKLAIEIDGATHFSDQDKDDARQKELEARGIRFLRFGDKEVKDNLDGVVMEIGEWISAHNS